MHGDLQSHHFRDASIATSEAVTTPFGTSLKPLLEIPLPPPPPPVPPPDPPPPLGLGVGQACCHGKVAGSMKSLISHVTGAVQQTVFLLSAVAAVPALEAL